MIQSGVRTAAECGSSRQRGKMAAMRSTAELPTGNVRNLGNNGLLCPLSRFLGAVVCSRTFFDAGFGLIYRAEERAAPKDVGDQTLMRGLCTAFPFMRPGLSLSKRGRRSKAGP